MQTWRRVPVCLRHDVVHLLKRAGFTINLISQTPHTKPIRRVLPWTLRCNSSFAFGAIIQWRRVIQSPTYPPHVRHRPIH
jgi:hypothetical protein